jgi:hypothetical protein
LLKKCSNPASVALNFVFSLSIPFLCIRSLVSFSYKQAASTGSKSSCAFHQHQVPGTEASGLGRRVPFAQFDLSSAMTPKNLKDTTVCCFVSDEGQEQVNAHPGRPCCECTFSRGNARGAI